MDINALLLQNSFAVNELLRQHNIIASDIQTGVKKAYDQYGETFLIKLINRVTKQTTSNNSGDTEEMGPPAPEGSTVVDGVTVVPSNGSGGNFWNIWGQLLTYVGASANLYGQVKNTIAGTTETTPYKYEGSNLNWLYIVAGLLVVVVIVVLILKK